MRLYLLTAALLQLPSLSMAQTESACASELKNYRDAIACAEALSPDVQVADAEVRKAKAEIEAAGQWKNPELSAESFQNTVNGQSNTQMDLALGVPIELGGKISARKSVAQAGAQLAEIRAQQARIQVRTQTLLKLHRLRQAFSEQDALDEAIGTFSKLIGQFSKRPKLSPEQEVSSSVFRMSKSEYEIKKVELTEEFAALNTYFKVNIGKDIQQLKSVLPESVKKWPEFQNDYKPGASSRTKIARAELQISQAQVSVAQSESWPTLTMGPSLQMQNQNGQSNQVLGLNASLPIPVFSTNSGGRAVAKSGANISDLRKTSIEKEEEKQREELLRVLDESKKVLDTTLSHQELLQRHHDVETSFLKGVVPSALVVEAHRTFIELGRSRNQRELKAIEAMFQIQNIDGNNLFP